MGEESALDEFMEGDNANHILTLRDKISFLKDAGFSIVRSNFTKNNPYISDEGSGFLEKIPTISKITPNYVEFSGITVEFDKN